MPVYVQHEVLGQIADVFNAEAIWQAPGLALFSRRPLLRDLLERSPREHRGRAATRCFSHVTLMLPQDEVDDDYHLTRGARARDLAQTLAALHQKDFGDLLGADQVRYDVVGTEALDAGQIEVMFGHAVYLPAADEKILYHVSVSRDSAIWQPVCPVYPNQRLALIGGVRASHAASAWPFGADDAILLINDGPDQPMQVQMRPKADFTCLYDPHGGYYTIRSTRAEVDGAARLLLKIARVSAPAVTAAGPRPASQVAPPAAGRVQVPPLAAAAPAAPQVRATPPVARHAVWQSRAARGVDPQRTALPAGERASATRQPVSENDATYAPLPQQRVSLVALAMPRLSRYRDTGAGALEIPFDNALNLSGAAAGTPSISFVVNADDELFACTAAGRQRITAPADFAPLDARSIRLLAMAPEMADRYCATLCLAQAVSLPVANGVRFVFGRNGPMLAALRLLDQTRFLHPAAGPGAGDGASADRLGLSRNAFSFEAGAQGFQIGRLAASQALYHLDQDMAFVARIDQDDTDAAYLLPPGHHLVAGHYVLRFDS